MAKRVKIIVATAAVSLALAACGGTTASAPGWSSTAKAEFVSQCHGESFGAAVCTCLESWTSSHVAYSSTQSPSESDVSSWLSKAHSSCPGVTDWPVVKNGSQGASQALLSCKTDALTVQTAAAAFDAENGSYPSSKADLLSSSKGGPYLSTWPVNSAYTISLVPNTGEVDVTPAGSTTPQSYATAGCAGVS
jgi:hypothetical protein